MGKKPDLSAIRYWGCKAWVKLLDAGKLEPRAAEGHFIGIDNESKGFRIYWPGKNTVSIERNVYFNENEVLKPDEVPIEGEYKIFNNSDHPQPSNTTQIIQKLTYLTKIHLIHQPTQLKTSKMSPYHNQWQVLSPKHWKQLTKTPF